MDISLYNDILLVGDPEALYANQPSAFKVTSPDGVVPIAQIDLKGTEQYRCLFGNSMRNNHVAIQLDLTSDTDNSFSQLTHDMVENVFPCGEVLLLQSFFAYSLYDPIPKKVLWKDKVRIANSMPYICGDYYHNLEYTLNVMKNDGICQKRVFVLQCDQTNFYDAVMTGERYVVSGFVTHPFLPPGKPGPYFLLQTFTEKGLTSPKGESLLCDATDSKEVAFFSERGLPPAVSTEIIATAMEDKIVIFDHSLSIQKILEFDGTVLQFSLDAHGNSYSLVEKNGCSLICSDKAGIPFLTIEIPIVEPLCPPVLSRDSICVAGRDSIGVWNLNGEILWQDSYPSVEADVVKVVAYENAVIVSCGNHLRVYSASGEMRILFMPEGFSAKTPVVTFDGKSWFVGTDKGLLSYEMKAGRE